MNNKQERPLTPKQKELIKRLEKIRQEEKQAKKTEKKDTVILGRMESAPQENTKRRRNEDAQNRQRRKEKAQQKQAQQDRDQPIANKYARPQTKKVEKKKDLQYTPVQRRTQAPATAKRKRKPAKKEKSKLIDQLTNGDSMAQAFVLSELLQKPVALRPRR